MLLHASCVDQQARLQIHHIVSKLKVWSIRHAAPFSPTLTNRRGHMHVKYLYKYIPLPMIDR